MLPVRDRAHELGERRIRPKLIWINANSCEDTRLKLMFDLARLARLARLFGEVGRTELNVAKSRPLAAVLDKPAVRKLRAALGADH
jgi:hypothetical protein